MSADVFYLKEVDVSVRVAKAEDVLLFGMLRNGLDNAVLGQEGVARRQLLLWRAFTVSFIEQQRTSWKRWEWRYRHKDKEMDTKVMIKRCRKKAKSL